MAVEPDPGPDEPVRGELEVVTQADMSTAQPAPAAAPANARTRIGLMQILAIPAVDKTIAIVASVPFVYALYRRLAEGNPQSSRGGATASTSNQRWLSALRRRR